MNRAVLLDRDGVLNEEVDPFLLRPDDVALIDGAARAVRDLNRAGLGVAVVTNQSCVGRGLISERQLDAIHARLADLLAAEGAHIDGWYVCPHAPGEGCDCRKPLPGLLLRASLDLGFEPAQTFFVGDAARDAAAARAAGLRPAFVLTGKGRAEATADPRIPVFDDLAAFVTWFLDGAP